MLMELRDAFRKLKEQNKGYLLAFGVGEFFEFRYYDANTIHDALPDLQFDTTVEYPRIAVHKLGFFPSVARGSEELEGCDGWQNSSQWQEAFQSHWKI